MPRSMRRMKTEEVDDKIAENDKEDDEDDDEEGEKTSAAEREHPNKQA